MNYAMHVMNKQKIIKKIKDNYNLYADKISAFSIYVIYFMMLVMIKKENVDIKLSTFFTIIKNIKIMI